MRKSRGWLLLALCVALASDGSAHAQQTDAPPPPVPVLPSDAPLQHPCNTPALPSKVTLDPPLSTAPPPMSHPPALLFSDRDPLLERPELPPPGWFFGLETAWVVPHVKNRLVGDVLIDGVQLDTVHVPPAELDSTIAPRFEIGYRLPDGMGEFLFTYRFVVSEGTNFFSDSNGLTAVKSRLNLNVFDFDYANRECSLEPNWDMQWRIGVRLAGIYFDSRSNLQTLPDMFAALNVEQQASNNFWGAGPHVGLCLTRKLNVPGMTFFANVEGATLLGQIRQQFSERFSFAGVPNVQFGGVNAFTHSQAVPTLSFQVGLGWSPPGWRQLRYSLGYEYEHWWSVGKVNASSAEVWDQGIFLRGEYNY